MGKLIFAAVEIMETKNFYCLMNTIKETYVSPQVEAMELKLEGVIALTVSGDWMGDEDDWTNS